MHRGFIQVHDGLTLRNVATQQLGVSIARKVMESIVTLQLVTHSFVPYTILLVEVLQSIWVYILVKL